VQEFLADFYCVYGCFLEFGVVGELLYLHTKLEVGGNFVKHFADKWGVIHYE